MKSQHSNRAPADAQKVNVYEPWEELYWGEKLRCTTEQLRAAVDAVGVSVADIKAYLEKAKRSHSAALPHSMPAARSPASARKHNTVTATGHSAPLFQ